MKDPFEYSNRIGQCATYLAEKCTLILDPQPDGYFIGSSSDLRNIYFRGTDAASCVFMVRLELAKVIAYFLHSGIPLPMKLGTLANTWDHDNPESK